MKTVSLVSNSAWGLYKFRLNLAKNLRNLGYRVIFIAPKDGNEKKLSENGFEFFHVPISSKGTMIIQDFRLIFHLLGIYRRIKPDLIIHYTIKPNIYGTLASKLCGIKSISVITGLGYVFINNSMVSSIAKMLYKISLQYSNETWFLNKEDEELFIKKRIISHQKSFVLNGEGIDTSEYIPKEKKENDKFNFLLIARLLWDKGIKEYLEAAKIIKNEYKNVNFFLLGPITIDNPSSIPESMVRKWHNDGVIEYLGTSDEVKKEIARADCVVLPSYREGIPRVLLEAASMEKPIIATDVSGCKDVVINGYNGYLCRKGDYQDLSQKMKKIISLKPQERLEMGKNGRRKMINEYDDKIVLSFYIDHISKY